MQTINLSYKNKLFTAVKQLNKAVISEHPVVRRRLEILYFLEEFGLAPTLKVFGISRSNLYLWKKSLKEHGQRGLLPCSKKPHHLRKSKISPLIEHFILDYRAKHPRICQYAIKPELDTFCKNNALPLISTSSIERVIAKLKNRGLLNTMRRMSVNGASGRIERKQHKKPKKLRKGNYMPATAGDIVQIDSVHLFVNGVKRYLITAIDVKRARPTKASTAPMPKNLCPNLKRLCHLK